MYQEDDGAAAMTLSERVEALEGADREVDALVWCAIEGIKPEWRDNMLIAGIYGCIGAIDPGERARNFTLYSSMPLRYTSSIDAALTLLPEGFDWLVRKDHGARLAFANVSEPHRIAVIDTFCEEDQAWRASDTTGANVSLAPTPCLALLAAILKARGL